MLTTFDLDEYVYAAMRAGASGFLLKDTPAKELVDAVRVIAKAMRSLRRLSPNGSSKSSPANPNMKRITLRCRPTSPSESTKHYAFWREA